MSRPLITIILACYNQERFVLDAVNGVLGQTYSPLEIVIFDDCSTDGTADIIKTRLARGPTPPNVRFVRNSKNLSGPVCCRAGIEMTSGSFIHIAHGDDVMLPEMIAEMAAVWLTDDVSLVTANAWYIDDHSKLLNRTHRDPGAPADVSFETLTRDGANACCFMPGLGFERDLYTTFGWPHDMLGAADIMIPFYAYLRKGARFIQKPLMKYRVHSTNSSLALTAERSDLLERLRVNERIYDGHIAHASTDEVCRQTIEIGLQGGPIAARKKRIAAHRITIGQVADRAFKQPATAPRQTEWRTEFSQGQRVGLSLIAGDHRVCRHYATTLLRPRYAASTLSKSPYCTRLP